MTTERPIDKIIKHYADDWQTQHEPLLAAQAFLDGFRFALKHPDRSQVLVEQIEADFNVDNQKAGGFYLDFWTTMNNFDVLEEALEA